ncbi:hypothetical protein QQP08_018012 [Theobroma cacao]|nr:hypothetical protein QQP08_018012 [Theobroma cacao]
MCDVHDINDRGLAYRRSPRYARSYSQSPDYYSPSPRRRRFSRSISPRDRRYRGRSCSRSPYGSRSPGRSFNRSRSQSLDYSTRLIGRCRG